MAHNARGVVVRAQPTDIGDKELRQMAALTIVDKVLKHVLEDVVTKLIRTDDPSIGTQELVHKGADLLCGAMLQQSLKNPAAEAMRGEVCCESHSPTQKLVDDPLRAPRR